MFAKYFERLSKMLKMPSLYWFFQVFLLISGKKLKKNQKVMLTKNTGFGRYIPANPELHLIRRNAKTVL